MAQCRKKDCSEIEARETHKKVQASSKVTLRSNNKERSQAKVK